MQKQNDTGHFYDGITGVKKVRAALYILLPAIVCCYACSAPKTHFSPTQKYSPEALRRDLDIAWQTYAANHPSLDWYNPADTVAARFARVRAGITDSLTESEFRLRLSYALASIRCGHTSVSASKAYRRYARNAKEPTFPLELKVWGNDSMVVARHLTRDSLRLATGTVITGIDGIAPGVFIRQMKAVLPTDGFNETFKEIQISASFGARFRQLYGLLSRYRISWRDSLGNMREDTLPLFKPALTPKKAPKDTLHLSARPAVMPKRPAHGNLRIDTLLRTAFLELNTFSNAAAGRLIRESFREMRAQKTQNLVLDLRTNGGGKIRLSTLLTRHLADRPFRVADSVSAKSLKLAYPRYTQAAWVYRYFRWVFVKKQNDGRYHMGSVERRVHKPVGKNHFSGKVFVLTGGNTFSASSLFLSKIFRQANVTVIGEETGGGARGNSAVNIPRVTLPHTGVRVRLPLFRIISDISLPDNGHGILPHVEVLPDSRYIRIGRDKKMETAIRLIREGQ